MGIGAQMPTEVRTGAAGLDADCCSKGTAVAAGGLETRVRVGVGAKQEVGGSVFLGMASSAGHGDMPFAIGGKASYKIAPAPWLAFVADGGALVESQASVAIASGDLAAIVAPYVARDGTQLYTGLRGTFAVPVLNGARDVNESLVLPIGVALRSSARTRFFIEGGPLLGFAQLVTDAAPNTSQNVTTLGGYGVAAVGFVLR
ncbi:MAG TPA: hypothetical protein VHB21_10525 [Minicystis sp.]|nr:hypothetical protein [Minicystis sp.]